MFKWLNRGCKQGLQQIKNNRKLSNSTFPILYGDLISPPVRFVAMTASVLHFKLDFHKIDLFKSEHKADFFTKINPLQKVPALDVGDAVICDSHAIALYLCENSDHTIVNSVYTGDSIGRALVNQMLFFNSGTLFPINSVLFAQYFQGQWPATKDKINQLHQALDYLEYRLSTHAFLTSDQMTLCDLCCGATVTSTMLLVPLSERHSRIKNWIGQLKDSPCFQINQSGVSQLSQYIKTTQPNIKL